MNIPTPTHKTHSIKCPKEGAVLAIRVAVSQASGVALDKLVLVELFMHQVHKVFKVSCHAELNREQTIC